MDIIASSKHAMLALGTAPVIWLMLVLSVLSVAVMLERALFFRAHRADIDALSSGLGERLRAGDLRGARALLEASRSFEAQAARVGLSELRRGPNAVREAMAAAVLLARKRLEQRLSYLGTLAANAPFIGLFGTVVGVIMAFDALGTSGARGSASAAVMASIAEALVTTALGIAIAVPAVAAFNAFQKRIARIADQSAALGHVLLAQLEAEHAARQSNGYADADALLGDAVAALGRHALSSEEA